MRHIITTSLGDFNVELSYSPSQGDLILNRFTSVINRYATQALITVSEINPELDPVKDSETIEKEALSLLTFEDEGKIEKALFDSTRVADGSRVPIKFSLKNKSIDVSAF